MKRVLLLLLAFCGLYMAANAQKKVPDDADAPRLLAGTWVVENKSLLPAKPEGDRKEFMLDTLIFTASKDFKNSVNDGQRKVWNYYSFADMGSLTIIQVSDYDGIEYQLSYLDGDKVVFLVLNKEGNDFVELAYNKVREKATTKTTEEEKK